MSATEIEAVQMIKINEIKSLRDPESSEVIYDDRIEKIEVNVDYDVNDSIRVVDGPLKDFIGTVQEINKEKQKVRVLVSMFGRETPVELEFSQVQKV